jgi:hypothetical protein
LKKIVLGSLFLIFALSCTSQIKPSDKINEILDVFKYTQKSDFSYLSSKNYKLLRSKADQINNRKITTYGWSNDYTKNSYLLKFAEKTAIGIYFSTFNADEYNNILIDAQKMGYKPTVNKSVIEDVGQNAQVYGKGDMIMAFAKSTQGNAPFFVVKVVQLTVWNTYMK